MFNVVLNAMTSSCIIQAGIPTAVVILDLNALSVALGGSPPVDLLDLLDLLVDD